MAELKLCSIPDCDKPSSKRGYCNAHYKRWRRYGDPLAGRTPKGDPLSFLEAALAYDGDDCLTWPYNGNSNGYGQVWVGGKKRVVSRIVCERVHGAPPTPEHDAAHSCGKGHEGCITPGHLSWKTRAGNHADKLEHGTHHRGERNPSAKITEPQAREIIQLKGKLPQREIAEKFSVSTATVSSIQNAKRWAWLSDT